MNDEILLMIVFVGVLGIFVMYAVILCYKLNRKNKECDKAIVELPDDWERGNCDNCPFNVTDSQWDDYYDGFYSYCVLKQNLNEKGEYIDCQLKVEEE